MGKPLLIGLTPSRVEGPDAWRRPLSGQVAKTLCRLAGISTLEMMTWYKALCLEFTCINAFPRPEDEARDSYAWLQARTRVEQAIEVCQPRAVICLGRDAAKAAGLAADAPWGRWVFHGNIPITVIPHPSGRNRLYNDESMHRLARRVLSEAIDSDRPGSNREAQHSA